MRNKTFRGDPISFLMLLLLSGDIHPCPGPTTMQDINNFCKARGLKCFHQNIRGLQGKYDEVKNILIQCKKIDIFFSLRNVLFLGESSVSKIVFPHNNQLHSITLIKIMNSTYSRIKPQLNVVLRTRTASLIKVYSFF